MSSDGGNESPPVRTLVAVGVYLFLAISAAVVFYMLTPVEGRADFLNHLWVLGPVVIAGIPGVLSWATGRRNEKSLNGTLEPRIKAATKAAIAEHEASKTQGE